LNIAAQRRNLSEIFTEEPTRIVCFSDTADSYLCIMDRWGVVHSTPLDLCLVAPSWALATERSSPFITVFCRRLYLTRNPLSTFFSQLFSRCFWWPSS